MSYVILRVFPDFICAQPTNKTNPPLFSYTTPFNFTMYVYYYTYIIIYYIKFLLC